MSKPDQRDVVIAALRAQLATMAAQFEEYRQTSEQLRTIESENARMLALREQSEQNADVSSNLNFIADGIEALGAKLPALLRKKEDQQTAADVLSALQSHVLSLSNKVQLSLDGGPIRPLLSEALDEWIDIRRGFGIDPKKINTDRNRIGDFIVFAGDKPANKYSYYDVQRFVNLLVRVPGNYSKIPQIKDKPRQEAADYNDRLPAERRLPTLSVKSIEDNYLSPLRMLFRDVAAQQDFRSPLTDVEIRISANATPSVERQPFGVPELNLLFAYSAGQERADMKWLPLLGAITGARVGELIYLQGKDVYRMQGPDGEGYWVLDLRSDLVGEDGSDQKRQIKNKTSRRLIALHEIFETFGFITYARTRRGDEWLFPGAFYFGKKRVTDPADAASKRLNRMLKDVGIHKPMELVFHSTRHTAKDIMRLAHVDERTHDLQTGHSLATVSKRYGSKHLVQHELEVLRSLPLPEGLDFSPYLSRP